MSNVNEINQDQDSEISFLDIFATLKENIKLLTVIPLLSALIALAVSFLIKPTYTATTTFLLPQQQQSAASAMLQGLGALGGLAGAAGGLKNPSDQYIAFLKSRSVQDALVNRFSLQERYGVELHADALVVLSTKVAINAGKDGLIKIDVDDTVATFAAQLANAHVEELRKLLSRLAVTEAQQRRVFYEKQLEYAKNKLSEAQIQLQHSGIKEGVLRSEPRMAAESYAKLKAEVTAAQVKLQSMRSYLSEQSPEFKLAQSNLNALAVQLNKTESVNAASVDSGYVSKYREFKYQETLFDMFAKQFELAKLDEARDGALIQVVDIAQAPERKSKPKKALISFVTGLVSGFSVLAFVFIRKAWRQSQQNARAAETRLV